MLQNKKHKSFWFYLWFALVGTFWCRGLNDFGFLDCFSIPVKSFIFHAFDSGTNILAPLGLKIGLSCHKIDSKSVKLAAKIASGDPTLQTCDVGELLKWTFCNAWQKIFWHFLAKMLLFCGMEIGITVVLYQSKSSSVFPKLLDTNVLISVMKLLIWCLQSRNQWKYFEYQPGMDIWMDQKKYLWLFKQRHVPFLISQHGMLLIVLSTRLSLSVSLKSRDSLKKLFSQDA